MSYLIGLAAMLGEAQRKLKYRSIHYWFMHCSRVNAKVSGRARERERDNIEAKEILLHHNHCVPVTIAFHVLRIWSVVASVVVSQAEVRN